jgi:hypothetical protein
MDSVEVTRNGLTNQFSIVLTRGSDTVRCMVSVTSGNGGEPDSDIKMNRAALSRAKSLARALDAAIADE